MAAGGPERAESAAPDAAHRRSQPTNSSGVIVLLLYITTVPGTGFFSVLQLNGGHINLFQPPHLRPLGQFHKSFVVL